MRNQLRMGVAILAVMFCGLLSTVSRAQQPSATPPAPMHDLSLFVGDSQAVGNGVAYSWVRIDEKTRPTAIGISFTEGALANLPDANTEYLLRLPDIVPHAPFNHIALDWETHGHFPTQFYGVPHFDFHFYTITPQARGQMTGAGADVARLNKQPAAQYIPQGYVPAYPAVQLMGLHWIRTDFPEFNNQPFTESLIYGSYNGRFTFIEPMVTSAFFLTKPNVDKPIYQPKAVQVSGYYPTRYTITYDAARQLYTVALTGLTYRQAK
ncbi:MAG: DUF5602 domain-containing protein [Armatimonadota bacterium]